MEPTPCADGQEDVFGDTTRPEMSLPGKKAAAPLLSSSRTSSACCPFSWERLSRSLFLLGARTRRIFERSSGRSLTKQG